MIVKKLTSHFGLGTKVSGYTSNANETGLSRGDLDQDELDAGRSESEVSDQDSEEDF